MRPICETRLTGRVEEARNRNSSVLPNFFLALDEMKYREGSVRGIFGRLHRHLAIKEKTSLLEDVSELIDGEVWVS